MNTGHIEGLKEDEWNVVGEKCKGDLLREAAKEGPSRMGREPEVYRV